MLFRSPAAGAGVVYGSVATISGAVFLREAYGLRRRAKAAVDLQPMRLFHYSITYLSLLFLAIGVDPFLR